MCACGFAKLEPQFHINVLTVGKFKAVKNYIFQELLQSWARANCLMLIEKMQTTTTGQAEWGSVCFTVLQKQDME